jgi:hypothetical protein
MRVAYVTRSEAIGALKSAAPEDLLLELLERGVTSMPPLNLLTKKAECPHCGLIGPVSRDFGVRVLGGTVRAQSWCRACRKNPKRGHVSEKKSPKNELDMVAQLRASLAKLKINRADIQKLAKAYKAM